MARRSGEKRGVSKGTERFKFFSLFRIFPTDKKGRKNAKKSELSFCVRYYRFSLGKKRAFFFPTLDKRKANGYNKKVIRKKFPSGRNKAVRADAGGNMGKESLEIALIKYNKKTWCKSALLGFFIGLAVIVPGISGSTVAIIFKLYDQFLYAVGNLFKQFKKCFMFLLPIGIGMVVGVLLGFFTVEKLLGLLPFAVVGLFAGLMSGAFPAVKDELKGAAMNAKRIALLIVGVLIPIAIGVVSVALNTSDASEAATNVFASVKWWQVLLCLPVGYIVGVTQIVPGLSATAVLMALGWFKSLVDSVSLTFWKSNPAILLVYAALVIGFLLGLFTFSKFLNYVFGKARHTAYSMIVGLSLGSIVSMFYNPDIFSQAYIPWKESGVEVLDLVLGIALFAVGAICSYMLVRYQRKKDADAAKAAETAPAAQPEEASDADGENR